MPNNASIIMLLLLWKYDKDGEQEGGYLAQRFFFLSILISLLPIEVPYILIVAVVSYLKSRLVV